MRVFSLALLFFTVCLSANDILGKKLSGFEVDGDRDSVLSHLKNALSGEMNYYILSSVDEEEDTAFKKEKPQSRFTYKFKDKTVSQILNQFCKDVGLCYKVKRNSLEFYYPDTSDSKNFFKVYKLTTSIKYFAKGAKAFLESEGVYFSGKSQVCFIKSTNSLWIYNNSFELSKLEELLTQKDAYHRISKMQRLLIDDGLEGVESISKELLNLSRLLKAHEVEAKARKLLVKPTVNFNEVIAKVDISKKLFPEAVREIQKLISQKGIEIEIAENPIEKFIQLKFNNAKLSHIFDEICQAFQMKYLVEGNKIIFYPIHQKRTIISREYPLTANICNFFNSFEDGLTHEQLFEKAGVYLQGEFPVVPHKRVLKLTIRTTLREHQKIREIFEASEKFSELVDPRRF